MSDPGYKVLIADDSPTNRKQLESVCQRLGLVPVIARDGLEAVAQFQAENPDLVFMDIMMPGMDGIEAVKHIRQVQTAWCPIIFYSAMDRMQDIVRGLEEGGDDYLVKPASLPLLRAKINNYVRQIALQRQNRDYTDELETWRDDARTQARLGAHVMAHLTDAEGMRDGLVRSFNIPTADFSGDLLCARRAPDEVLHLLLADGTGHGLAAALATLPVTQIFYSMTAKGFPIASIAEELNRRLKAILPADMFVAATLAAVDVRNQTVEVWNGGNPDALFISLQGETLLRWPSRHPPLGILPEALFSGSTETDIFQEPGDVVMFSDGLAEAENAAGQWFGVSGVEAAVTRSSEQDARFNFLREAVLAHLGERSNHDDLSFLTARLPMERRQSVRFQPQSQEPLQGPVSTWRLELSYGMEELRYLDVVPMVLNLINQVQSLKPHQGTLFLIISELFNNAMDHGLLGLDSSLKAQDGGFDLFLQERSHRLEQQVEGRIDLSILLHQTGDQAVLDIGVTDTGPGFDFLAILNGELKDEDGIRPHGRGMRLVRSLGAELRYAGKGNSAWARYVLSSACATTP